LGHRSAWARRGYLYDSGTHVVEDGFLRASDPDIAVPLAEIFD
jgi:hypothetical protein